jgi:hypothetical protein
MQAEAKGIAFVAVAVKHVTTYGEEVRLIQPRQLQTVPKFGERQPWCGIRPWLLCVSGDGKIIYLLKQCDA